MEAFGGFIKTLLSLIWQGIVISFNLLKTVFLKFWKVILVIITFIISLVTFRIFKKKGGQLE